MATRPTMPPACSARWRTRSTSTGSLSDRRHRPGDSRLAAIPVLFIATQALTIVFGWLFLISGVVGLFSTFSCARRRASGGRRSRPTSPSSPLASCWPGRSPGRSLTFLLIIFFVIEGFATIIFAIDHRANLFGRWGWMLASGIVDLILAVIIFACMPSSAIWAIGLLLGINMVFGGTAMIGMAGGGSSRLERLAIIRSSPLARGRADYRTPFKPAASPPAPCRSWRCHRTPY